MSVRESLLALRRACLERLRAKDPTEVLELERIDRALASLEHSETTNPDEFSHMRVIDALKAHLMRVGRPLSREDLTQALIQGGVAKATGERASEWKITLSLNFHIRKGVLTEDDGLIGLAEWKE